MVKRVAIVAREEDAPQDDSWDGVNRYYEQLTQVLMKANAKNRASLDPMHLLIEAIDHRVNAEICFH